jgi:hypothetical protein
LERKTNEPTLAPLAAQASANSKQSSDLESALLLITKSRQGAPLPDESAGWQEFHLPPLEFSEFRQRLKCDQLLDYFENELRWDYSPGSGSLVQATRKRPRNAATNYLPINHKRITNPQILTPREPRTRARNRVRTYRHKLKAVTHKFVPTHSRPQASNNASKIDRKEKRKKKKKGRGRKTEKTQNTKHAY